MKFIEVTAEKMEQVKKKVYAIVKDTNWMTDSTNKLLKGYGALHHQLAQNIITLAHANEKKAEYKVMIKNVAIQTYDAIILGLKGIKETYVSDVMPEVEKLSDPVELMLVEKEIKVMTDKELLAYYNENFQNDTIARLCNLEHKSRHGHTEGKIYMPLPEAEYVDEITVFIDEYIQKYAALKSASSSMCAIVTVDEELGIWDPKMISWDVVFKQVENKNLHNQTTVTLDYFMQGNHESSLQTLN